MKVSAGVVEFIKTVAAEAADLRKCEGAGHAPDSRADVLEDKAMLLLIQLGADWRTGRQAWVDAARFAGASPTPTGQYCQATIDAAAATEARLHQRLVEAYRGEVPLLASCPLPAELYRDRMASTAKEADLVCAAKAGTRDDLHATQP